MPKLPANRGLSEGFLRPTGRQIAIIIGVSVVLGVLSYAITVGAWSYRGLQQALAKANVFNTIFAQRTDLQRTASWSIRTGSQETRRRLLFESTKSMGLVPADQLFEELSASELGPGFDLLFRALADDTAGVKFDDAPSLQCLVAIAQALGASNNSADESDVRLHTATVLSCALAGLSDTWEAYRARATDESSDSRAQSDGLASLASRASSVSHMVRFAVLPPQNFADVPTDSDVVTAVLSQMHGLDHYHALLPPATKPSAGSRGSASGKKGSEALSPESLALIRGLMLEIVSRLQADAGVRWMNFVMSLWRGYVTLAMWVVFWASIVTLTCRELMITRLRRQRDVLQEGVRLRVYAEDRRSPSRAQRIQDYGNQLEAIVKKDLAPGLTRELARICMQKLAEAFHVSGTDVDTGALAEARDQAISVEANSRWWIGWLAKALPALGFLGTVIGISLALSNADSIVRASSQSSQAAAITSVSAMLGMSFTTTMLALFMGLIVSFWNDLQAARERKTIREIAFELWRILEDVPPPSNAASSAPAQSVTVRPTDSPASNRRGLWPWSLLITAIVAAMGWVVALTRTGAGERQQGIEAIFQLDINALILHAPLLFVAIVMTIVMTMIALVAALIMLLRR